jgi:hypothetical protein
MIHHIRHENQASPLRGGETREEKFLAIGASAAPAGRSSNLKA